MRFFRVGQWDYEQLVYLVIKIISFYFFNIDIVQPFSHKARLINLLTTWVTFLAPALESGPASEQCGQQPDR